MVSEVRIGATPDRSRTFEAIVAVDETGVHDESAPTVVSASFVRRSNSERVVRELLDSGIEPWLQKSTDVDESEARTFHESTSVRSRARAAWGHLTAGQRGLMAMEASKQVVAEVESFESETESCLMLLDGRPSNYGGRRRLLQSRAEVIDDYFETKHDVDIEIATLPHGDVRYPELTVADCVCRAIRASIESGVSIEQTAGVERFDGSRGVPSVDSVGRVYELAPQGIAEEGDDFVPKVATWLYGKRPSTTEVGEIASEQFRKLIRESVSDERVRKYVLDTEERLRSRRE